MGVRKKRKDEYFIRSEKSVEGGQGNGRKSKERRDHAL